MNAHSDPLGPTQSNASFMRLVHPLLIALLMTLGVLQPIAAQLPSHPFTPLDQELPPGNDYRTATGKPGPGYWQQQVDYDIFVKLDDNNQTIAGSETITYYNNSPHTLEFLWIQLDQNKRKVHSCGHDTEGPVNPNNLNISGYTRAISEPFDGGYTILDVSDRKGKKLPHHIYDSHMRVDMPEPLAPGKSLEINVAWRYRINDGTIEGRSGYEYFPADRNYIYCIAQFFPRLCKYSPDRGWQNTPFLGRAEFGLEFGNYNVSITVPEDHVIWATGDLMNANEVLSKQQKKLLDQAMQSDRPLYIVTPEEALAVQSSPMSGQKTWKFSAKNVRDFAFASSRKFVWDACGVTVGGKRVLAQSLYPTEAMPLWDKYATHANRHTLVTYSKYSVDYPYPHSTVVHGPVWGMEYPMMSFCRGRPQADGTYSEMVKYATISVIIHEVGHNFFPMIVNSDERRWAWLDEGFNTYLQYLTEQEWEPNYPSRRGPANSVVDYLNSPQHQPIMFRPEAITQLGANAYTKVAVGLNMLRETIVGRQAFDYAFREYSRRWAYRTPEPMDFFRTISDVSGVELDWFWRGWFYDTQRVDLALAGVTLLQPIPLDPEKRAAWESDQLIRNSRHIGALRNDTAISKYYVDGRDELLDAYSLKKIKGPQTDMNAVVAYDQLLGSLSATERAALESNQYLYQVKILNHGMVMPLIYRIRYEDGSNEVRRQSAYVWMQNSHEYTLQLVSDRAITGIELDPFLELPDSNRHNNQWAGQPELKFFELKTTSMRPGY
jgi:hypothetical protein